MNCLKGLCAEVKSCVRASNSEFTKFYDRRNGFKQGCLCSPLLFSLFINELGLASELLQNGKHCIQLSPDQVQLLLLLFADEVALLSDTLVGLQNQIDVLMKFADSYNMKVNLAKTKAVVFRKGGIFGQK